MCGIAGAYAPEAVKRTKESLLRMACRGRDLAGLYTGNLEIVDTPDQLTDAPSNFALGHVLHAQIGLVAQPLIGKGALVANCEIYNWKELAIKENIHAGNDVHVLLHLLDKHWPNIQSVTSLLDGVYAFAYQRDDTLTLCRDILGVKPLYYSTTNGFSFASEQKALENATELFPRIILQYSTDTGLIVETERAFFELEPEHSNPYEQQRDTLAALIFAAVKKRVPEKKFGILFSGGLDSTLIALLLKEYSPTCYVVGTDTSPDVVAARIAAQTLGLNLRVVEPNGLEQELPAIMHAIEDSSPVKTSIAATFWFACKQASIDGCTTLFSGLGADELFAGYERARKSTSINKDCLASLRKLHERDLYRDDVITMHHSIELRVPFLDKTLVEYALKIPSNYKFAQRQKQILRDAAILLGLPEDIAERKKKAAQYGSHVMKNLEKLSKGQNLARYLSKISGKKNKRLAALLSTGKDSVLALHVMNDMQYTISCAITIQSDNPDSFMYHTPTTDLASLQAESLGVPLILARTEGKKEEELDALTHALREAKAEYGVEGVVVGALASQYQRERVEKVADRVGLTVFAPLWQMDQVQELKLLVKHDFHVIITKVAADGLDASWLGRKLDAKMIDELITLQQTKGVHPAGEGGEYETLVLNAPLFRRKLVIKNAETIKDGIAATLQVNATLQ